MDFRVVFKSVFRVLFKVVWYIRVYSAVCICSHGVGVVVGKGG